MPSYIRPARVDVTEGGTGGLVFIAAAIATAAAVVLFVLAHLVLLAVCAGVFVTVMGAVLTAMQWAASPRRLRQHLHPRYTASVPARRPARVLPAPRPRPIEAPRTVPAQVRLRDTSGAR